MGYFACGSEGMDYEERYCRRCIHGVDEACPVMNAHLLFNYDECNKPDSILHMLIPRSRDGLTNLKCAMFVKRRRPDARSGVLPFDALEAGR